MEAAFKDPWERKVFEVSKEKEKEKRKRKRKEKKRRKIE